MDNFRNQSRLNKLEIKKEMASKMLNEKYFNGELMFKYSESSFIDTFSKIIIEDLDNLITPTENIDYFNKRIKTIKEIRAILSESYKKKNLVKILDSYRIFKNHSELFKDSSCFDILYPEYL